MNRPLDGVVVLDLTHAYSGPFGTMHLADHGAEVIKVEVPNVGDQTRSWGPMKNNASGYFSYINRNKKGITVNLKNNDGKKVFEDLVKKADVICENFRVGTLEKLGYGYDSLKNINPKIIYAKISGYGSGNSYSNKPAYDIIAQAYGGMMSITGFKENCATKAGPSIGDNYAGTYMALAIAMSLYNREKTGLGSKIDISMVNTIFSILEFNVIDYTIGGNIPVPEGNRDPKIAPFESYMTSDGMCVIACGTDRHFHLLCDQMNMPELKADPRFITNMDRVTHYNELTNIIQSWTKVHSLKEIEELMDEVNIPFGRVNNIKEACEFEPIVKSNMLWNYFDNNIGEEISVPGTPIKYEGIVDEVTKAAPVLGEDTNSVLRKLLDYNDEKIDDLRNSGAI